MRYLDRVRRLALLLALLSCRTSAPTPAPVASAPDAPVASAPARRPAADPRAALIELLPMPRNVRLLLAAIDGFLATRPAAHPSRGGTCGVHVFDGPSVAAEVRRDGVSERYVSDEICALGVSQQALFDLAERVDIVTGSARWTGAPRF